MSALQETKTSRAGSRRRLPENDKACASCGEARGKRRTGWHQVTTTGMDSIERVAGWTCPNCPTWGEPIRRELTKRGTIRFRAVVDATPAGDSHRRQVARRFLTLPEARTFVMDVRHEVAHAGTYGPPIVESVADLCATWLASRTDIREVTRQGYHSALAPALRRIGSRPVAEVTVTEVEALAVWMSTEGGSRGQALSPRSVRAALIAMGQAFDMAMREDRLTRNVVRLARRPRQRQSVGVDLEHWQPAELLRFRATADSDSLGGAWRLTLSGLTRADVMGLRWSDIDLDVGTVTIRQGRVALDKGDQIDEPKSAQRRRTVPVEQLHPGTCVLLRALKADQARWKLLAGPAWVDTGLVVVSELGNGIRPEVYSDRFRRLCSRAEVPVIRLHSVRHSLAFWLHRLGVTPAAAAALLGHTVEVHLNTYLPEGGADGIAAAAAALSTATGLSAI
ncbi:tyrosine-type recombinase/integrase [Demequina oxidasica]|uniref:tyrosine-type recombinase/integrase n=1 Tax=Demequina oxidasica TaxID=676199 RepID=UPI000785BAF7|nr:site-specific integrase [Demequina oxidasica]